MLLDSLFGNETAEKTLLYLSTYGDGYALKIARVFDLPVSQVQRQLLRFERAGVLVSQLQGRTRVFLWNPRYLFREELQAILKKALRFLPETTRERYFMSRTRPRRTGKP